MQLRSLICSAAQGWKPGPCVGSKTELGLINVVRQTNANMKHGKNKSLQIFLSQEQKLNMLILDNENPKKGFCTDCYLLIVFGLIVLHSR